MNLLSEVWTDEAKQFGEHTVLRPTPHRINVLMRRRNKWISDTPRDQTDLESVAEWLFVLSRSAQELTQLFRVDAEAWEEAIDEFLQTLDGVTLDEFQAYFQKIADAMEAAQVEDAEPGKQTRNQEPSHVS